MAKSDNLTDFLTDIAAEVRAQTGNYNEINPQDFALLLASASSLEEKDVNFYDIDGELLYAYAWDEIEALTELPEIPHKNRGGLLNASFQWNFTLEEIKAQKVHHCDVGISYNNEDNCYFIVNIPSDNYSVSFAGTLGSGGINWGDGTSNKTKTHIFKKGIYKITVFGYCEGSTKYNTGGILPTEIVSEAYIGILARGNVAATRRFSIHKTSGQSSVHTILLSSNCPCVVSGRNTINVATMFNFCAAKKIILNPSGGSSLEGLQGNSNLETFCIPEGVTTIDALINNYKLKRVYCPSTITHVDMCYGCRSLEFVDFSASAQVPTLNINSFWNAPESFKIIVPDELYDSWLSSWSNLASHIIKKSDWDAQQVTE